MSSDAPKSALRKRLDARTDYTDSLTSKPISVPVTFINEDGTTAVEHIFYKPVGSTIKDLYLREIIEQKLSGFHRMFFYRALDENGKRLYRNKKDLTQLLNDPDSAPYVEFCNQVIDAEGFESFPTDSEVKNAEGN